MSAPAVGICAAIDRVVRGPWDEEVAFVQRTYVAAVDRAGGQVLVLPPSEGASPDALLDRLDALLLAGGADIDPASYGAERDPETTETWPERDRFEIGLARRAVERGMPLLGVCRGMQLLNVARGGTLIQHLPDVLGNDAHRTEPGVFGDEHDVRLQPGSLAARAAGTERTIVKSHHHQGVDRLGEGLVATGWSEPDDVTEAIELPDRPYALGVLWHPEEDGESRVIASLVEAGHS